MNDILYIVPRALDIGVLISAPMGPIGMLVIQRTLSKGRWPAFFTGLGAALSDLVYCLLSGLCLSFITDFINRTQSAYHRQSICFLRAYTPHKSAKPRREYPLLCISSYHLSIPKSFIVFV